MPQNSVLGSLIWSTFDGDILIIRWCRFTGCYKRFSSSLFTMPVDAGIDKMQIDLTEYENIP